MSLLGQRAGDRAGECLAGRARRQGWHHAHLCRPRRTDAFEDKDEVDFPAAGAGLFDSRHPHHGPDRARQTGSQACRQTRACHACHPRRQDLDPERWQRHCSRARAAADARRTACLPEAGRIDPHAAGSARHWPCPVRPGKAGHQRRPGSFAHRARAARRVEEEVGSVRRAPEGLWRPRAELERSCRGPQRGQGRRRGLRPQPGGAEQGTRRSHQGACRAGSRAAAPDRIERRTCARLQRQGAGGGRARSGLEHAQQRLERDHRRA